MSMTDQVPESLQHFLLSVEDPRTNTWLVRYPLEFLLLSALLAVMCGADSFYQISLWTRSQRRWLETLIEVPEQTPSHDTYSRVFALLDASVLESAFSTWTRVLAGKVKGFVALDGKTVRASRDDETPALHLLNAWASENAMILGQMRVEDHENEIVGLPRLIQALDLEECTITIDAMGCQVDIAQAIVDQGADYVLRVKANQQQLHLDLMDLFDTLRDPPARDQHIPHVFWEHVDKGHGRLEIRRAWATSKRDDIASLERWPELESVVLVESLRENLKTGEQTRQLKYFISSRWVNTQEQLKEIARGIRQHWGVENKVHWVLDVQMNEDRSTSRRGSSGQILSLWRKLALHMYRNHKEVEAGAKAKMMLAANDKDYLLRVLASE